MKKISQDFNKPQLQAKLLRKMFPGIWIHMECGVGLGKSYFMVSEAIKTRLTLPEGKMIAYAARDLNQYRKSIVPIFRKILTEDYGFIEGVDYTINKQSCELMLFGKQVMALSAEAYDSQFRAMTLAAIFGDEIDFWRAVALSTLQTRLRAEPMINLTGSSPAGFNHVWEMFHNSKDKVTDFIPVDDDYFSNCYISYSTMRVRIHAPTHMNHFNPPEYVRKLKRDLLPKIYRQEVLAERLSLNQGAVYDKFDRKHHVKEFDKKSLYRRGVPVVCSLDYNVANFHCNFHIKKIEWNEIEEKNETIFYSVDEIKLEYKNIDDMALAIKEKIRLNGWHNDDVSLIGDAAGNEAHSVHAMYTAYEVFQSHGINTRQAFKPAVSSRVICANSQLNWDKVVIHKECLELIKDLEQVSWDKKGKIDKKDEKVTHASDAWSYWLWDEVNPEEQGSITVYR